MNVNSNKQNETLNVDSRRAKSRACYISKRQKTDVLTKNNKYWQNCKMIMYLMNNIHTSERGPRGTGRPVSSEAGNFTI